ncbi:MAG: YHS domain-containing protein [Thermoplasmatales archaeon]
MIRDPVCGMNVDEGTKLSAQYKGKTYYFCSQSCKKNFVSNPERFVKL